jgi:putative ATP-dependent endonuclease of OLD family
MYIRKVNIENFKCYKGKFSLNLNDGVNIIVGNNEAGKSTILEAIHLGLSGLLNGRYLRNELSQYLFNNEVEKEYIDSLKAGRTAQYPPAITIEVFFETVEHAILRGNNNSDREDAVGVSLIIEFDKSYRDEYDELIMDEVHSIPIEYYTITWRSFARDNITSRSIPMKSVIIDSAVHRYGNGSDIYISRIIKDELDQKERVAVSQAYRKLKDQFKADPAITAINKKVDDTANITDKEVSISVNLSAKDSWETGLSTFLDNVPFENIGKGEQSIVKTNLALGNVSAQKAGIVLLEEPENHLSHTKLNQFVRSVQKNLAEKQVIITTHSSFVANKLGLDKLIFLHDQKTTSLKDLSKGTRKFFRKLPGYDTLRLLLSEKAILVEGDSDELIVQRCYMDKHTKTLPIENGIEVISVGLSFKRFLEIAEKIGKPTAVVTDNDHDHAKKVVKKYKAWETSTVVKIFADKRDELHTLEPQFVDANKDELEMLRRVLRIDSTDYDNEEKISKWMKKHKTDWALAVFSSKKKFNYPQYVNDAIDWCDA